MLIIGEHAVTCIDTNSDSKFITKEYERHERDELTRMRAATPFTGPEPFDMYYVV